MTEVEIAVRVRVRTVLADDSEATQRAACEHAAEAVKGTLGPMPEGMTVVGVDWATVDFVEPPIPKDVAVGVIDDEG